MSGEKLIGNRRRIIHRLHRNSQGKGVGAINEIVHRIVNINLNVTFVSLFILKTDENLVSLMSTFNTMY